MHLIWKSLMAGQTGCVEVGGWGWKTLETSGHSVRRRGLGRRAISPLCGKPVESLPIQGSGDHVIE